MPPPTVARVQWRDSLRADLVDETVLLFAEGAVHVFEGAFHPRLGDLKARFPGRMQEHHLPGGDREVRGVLQHADITPAPLVAAVLLRLNLMVAGELQRLPDRLVDCRVPILIALGRVRIAPLTVGEATGKRVTVGQHRTADAVRIGGGPVPSQVASPRRAQPPAA